MCIRDRYKEAVKELIDKNLSENEIRRQEFEEKSVELEKDTPAYYRNCLLYTSAPTISIQDY